MMTVNMFAVGRHGGRASPHAGFRDAFLAADASNAEEHRNFAEEQDAFRLGFRAKEGAQNPFAGREALASAWRRGYAKRHGKPAQDVNRGRWGARAADASAYSVLQGRSHSDIQKEISDPATSAGRKQQLQTALSEAQSNRLSFRSNQKDPYASFRTPLKFSGVGPKGRPA